MASRLCFPPWSRRLSYCACLALTMAGFAARGVRASGAVFDLASLPKPRSTGTTIAGVVFDGGVVLGADTRATNEHMVADKECVKIHKLSSRVYCCAAGTSADCERLAQGARLELLDMSRREQLRDNRTPLEEVQARCIRVHAAEKLLQRYLYSNPVLSSVMLLGGVDATGFHLSEINSGGSVSRVQYAALGSGTFAAISTLEAGFRKGMSEEEAKVLVRSAISAGISNDLYSGSSINLAIIKRKDVTLEHSSCGAPPVSEGPAFMQPVMPFKLQDRPVVRSYHIPAEQRSSL